MMAEVEYEEGPRKKAAAALDTAGSAVRDTAGTAKEQAADVAGEAKAQARGLAHEVRDRVGTEVRGQHDRLAGSVRRFADELDQMAGERGDSPASKVVTQVSQGGRRIADYLEEHGPEGVLEGVQDFARRKPGTFLLAAAAAGFVAGRLGRGIFGAGDLDEERAPVAPTTTVPPATFADTQRLSADTQRLSPPPAPVPPVPFTPEPETPATVGTATTYPGSPAAAGTGLAGEPIPTSASGRP